MNTKEFEQKLEELGYYLKPFRDNDNDKTPYYKYFIVDCGGYEYASIGTSNVGIISTENGEFANLTLTNKCELLDLLVEFIKTPLNKRVPEKRYRLKLTITDDSAYFVQYLNIDRENKKMLFSTEEEGAMYQTIFTDSEITNMGSKVWDMINAGILISEEVNNG